MRSGQELPCGDEGTPRHVMIHHIPFLHCRLTMHWDFMATPTCPASGDKNPETLGQDARSPDTRRTLSPAVIAATLILVIGGMAFLGQTIIIHHVTVPVAANASTSPFPPPTPDVPGTQAIVTMSSPLQPDRTTPSQSADPEPSAAPPANPGASPSSSTVYSM